MQCRICGEYDCTKHEFSIGKVTKKTKLEGSSPPEIFVGRWNYPNVYTGVLAPEEYGDTHIMSSAKKWHARKLSISEISSLRQKLVYGRTQSHIKKSSPFLNLVKEIAMTHKSVAAELNFKKPIHPHTENDITTPLITQAAPIEYARLQENAPVKPKVDYIVNDTNVKARTSIKELAHAGIPSENIMKLFSAGLLGQQSARKLVPTRWSITAVDDTLSKQHLEKIRDYPLLQEIQLFEANYLGNYYNFLVLPENFAFEVIEISHTTPTVWQDAEGFFARKTYADSVTGAYYANRLALTEYLTKIKRQAACLVMREIRPEYNAPCGVGILRQASREAFSKVPETFETIQQALTRIQSRMNLDISQYTTRSQLLKNTGKQKKLTQFFS
jgi:hypothetical protein